MITLQIPLTTFVKINGSDKCKGQTIVCDTTYNSGILDYIDIINLYIIFTKIYILFLLKFISILFFHF